MSESGADEVADTVATVESEDDHPAVQVLTRLLQDGQVTKDAAAQCQAKFRRLHQAFQQSCAAEQQLLRRTRELNKELKSQKQTIQSSSVQQQEHRAVLSTLREFVTNIQHELESIYERIDQTRGNTAMKRRERDRLRDRVAKAQDDQLLKIEPQKRQVQVEIDQLVQQTAQQTATRDSLAQQAQALQARLDKAEASMSETSKRRRVVDQRMAEISLIPIKTRQRSSVVETSHTALLVDEHQANANLQAAQSQLSGMLATVQTQTVANQKISDEIDGMMRVVADIRQRGEELRQQLQARQSKKLNAEYEGKRAGKVLTEHNGEITLLSSKIDVIERDRDRREREQTRLNEAIARIQHDLDLCAVQVHSAQMDIKVANEQKADQKRAFDGAMAAQEAAVKAAMAVTELSQETRLAMEAVKRENDRRTEIHDRLVGKERDLAMSQLEAGIMRDRKARSLASLKKRLAEHRQMAQELNLDLVDLGRKEQESEVRVTECSDMYERVKMDRNRNVSHIQTARQLIVEYREKVRILESEVAVLREEFEQMDASVKLQKAALGASFNRRDASRSELKRMEVRCHELNSRIDLQQNDLARLSSSLGGVERSVQDQKTLYSRQLDDCSAAQRELIDKRDQLSLMYEALNRHEDVLRRGELALREREQEHKMLTCQLRDFWRQIDVLRRCVPQLEAYDAELADLVSQVDAERKEVDKVTNQLEMPELHERKRQYCGRDIGLAELQARVARYEQRINEKEQQLWERQILLREVTDKLAGLHGSSDGEGLAGPRSLEQRGVLRTRAMAIQRRKKATLAEVAVYQATSSELKEEQDGVRAELEAAQERTAHGEDFDHTASRMMTVAKRDLARTRARIPDSDEEDETRPPGRPHFDAYPTADGLSRPYGGFPIFQPGPRPGHLRHYRPEGVRAIEV